MYMARHVCVVFFSHIVTMLHLSPAFMQTCYHAMQRSQATRPVSRPTMSYYLRIADGMPLLAACLTRSLPAPWLRRTVSSGSLAWSAGVRRLGSMENAGEPPTPDPRHDQTYMGASNELMPVLYRRVSALMLSCSHAGARPGWVTRGWGIGCAGARLAGWTPSSADVRAPEREGLHRGNSRRPTVEVTGGSRTRLP